MKNIFFLFLLLSMNAFAQDSTNKNPGILSRKTLGSFKMDGKRIAETTVKTEIYKVPAAISIYKKAKNSEIISLSSFAPALMFALLGNSNSYHRRDTVHNSRIRGNTVGLLLSEVSIVFFFFRSAKFYKKALRIRNAALKPAY